MDNLLVAVVNFSTQNHPFLVFIKIFFQSSNLSTSGSLKNKKSYFVISDNFLHVPAFLELAELSKIELNHKPL